MEVRQGLYEIKGIKANWWENSINNLFVHTSVDISELMRYVYVAGVTYLEVR